MQQASLPHPTANCFKLVEKWDQLKYTDQASTFVIRNHNVIRNDNGTTRMPRLTTRMRTLHAHNYYKCLAGKSR